jgi:phage N-6-adenine-methyltransferase
MSNDEWTTPRYIFEWLNEVGRFDIDACATAENALCPRFWTKEQDAMKQKWDGNVFCNPPYSRKSDTSYGILEWCKRANDKHHKFTRTLLIPADTSTEYFRYCFHDAYTIFLLPRLKFGGSTQSAKFGSMVVTFSMKTYTLRRSINAEIIPIPPEELRDIKQRLSLGGPQ